MSEEKRQIAVAKQSELQDRHYRSFYDVRSRTNEKHLKTMETVSEFRLMKDHTKQRLAEIKLSDLSDNYTKKSKIKLQREQGVIR